MMVRHIGDYRPYCFIVNELECRRWHNQARGRSFLRMDLLWINGRETGNDNL